MEILLQSDIDSYFQSSIEPSPLGFLTNQVVEVFLESYWQKEQVHVECSEDQIRKQFLTQLYNTKVMQKHLLDVRFPMVMGVDISSQEDNLADHFPSKESIHGLLGLKRTICINQPQRYNDNLWRLIAGLEDELGCLVSCTVYVSITNLRIDIPKTQNAQTFIIQTQGKTKWSFSDENEEEEQDDDIDYGRVEVTLSEGDVLYIPRGASYWVESVPSGSKFMHQYFIQLSTYSEWTCGDLAMTAIKTLTRDLTEQQAIPEEFQEGLPPGIVTQSHPFHSMAYDTDQTFNFSTAQQKVVQSLRLMADMVENSDRLIGKAVHEFSHEFFDSRLPPHPKQIRSLCPQSPQQKIVKLGNFCRIIPPEETEQIKENQILLRTTINNNRENHMMFGLSQERFFFDEEELAMSADVDGSYSGKNAAAVFSVINKKNKRDVIFQPRKRAKYVAEKFSKERIVQVNKQYEFAEHDFEDETIQKNNKRKKYRNGEIFDFQLDGVEEVSDGLVFDMEYLGVLKQIIMLKRHEQIVVNNLMTPKNLPNEKLLLAKLLWKCSVFGLVSDEEKSANGYSIS